MMPNSIEDVPMVCDICGSTFRLGDCEAKDAYEHDGPYEGEIGCPVSGLRWNDARIRTINGGLNET